MSDVATGEFARRAVGCELFSVRFGDGEIAISGMEREGEVGCLLLFWFAHPGDWQLLSVDLLKT